MGIFVQLCSSWQYLNYSRTRPAVILRDSWGCFCTFESDEFVFNYYGSTTCNSTAPWPVLSNRLIITIIMLIMPLTSRKNSNNSHRHIPDKIRSCLQSEDSWLFAVFSKLSNNSLSGSLYGFPRPTRTALIRVYTSVLRIILIRFSRLFNRFISRLCSCIV